MYIDTLNWCKHIDKLNKKSKTIQDLTPLFITICTVDVQFITRNQYYTVWYSLY